jgi:hypothetical protein
MPAFSKFHPWLLLTATLALAGCLPSETITETATLNAIGAIEAGEEGSTLAARVVALEASLAEAEAQDSAQDARLDEVEALAERLNQVEDDLASLDERVLAIELAIDDPASENDLRDRLAAAKADVASLQTETATLRADVGAREDEDLPLDLQSRLVGIETWQTGTARPTFADHGARLDDLETWVSTTGEPSLDDLYAQVAAVRRDYATVSYVNAQISATETYCDEAVADADADLRDALTDLDDALPEFILEDTTWTVDGIGGSSTTFKTPADAVDAAHRVRITGDAILTLKINDGTYSATTPLEVHHPDGLRLHIIGNTTDPSKVVLKFTGTYGVLVQDGNALGMLAGVTVQGDGTVTQCVTASNDAFMTLGEKTVVEKCSNGLVVNQHSFVWAPNLVAQDNTLDGIHVVRGSTFSSSKAVSRRNGEHGLQVFANSAAFVQGGAFSGNGSYGIFGLVTSSADVAGGTASGNRLAPYSPAINTLGNYGSLIFPP